ncbi:MAG: hypothetical protein Q9167_002163 [Letrouitia subvulpina]
MTEKTKFGGIILVAHSLKFYVAVNGRRRRQDSALEGIIPSVELGSSAIEAVATKTSTPPATNVGLVHCFEPTDREIAPISLHDCQISQEMMLHEPGYLEPRIWSHVPPRPNTRQVPEHWPFGNCDIILTCHNLQAVDTFRLLDVGLAVKAILDQCPPRRKYDPLGGVTNVGHGRSFYVLVNGRGRAQQNNSAPVDISGLIGNETIASKPESSFRRRRKELGFTKIDESPEIVVEDYSGYIEALIWTENRDKDRISSQQCQHSNMGNLETNPELYLSTSNSGALDFQTRSRAVRQCEAVNENLSEDELSMSVAPTTKSQHTHRIARRILNRCCSQQHSLDDLSAANESPSTNKNAASDRLLIDESIFKDPIITSSDARHLYPANQNEVAVLQYALGPTLEDIRHQVDIEPLVDTSQSYMEQITSLQRQVDTAWVSIADSSSFGEQPGAYAPIPRPLIHLTRWEGSITNWRSVQFTDGLGLWDIPGSDDDEEREGEPEEVEETMPPESSAQNDCGFKIYEDPVVHEDRLPK